MSHFSLLAIGFENEEDLEEAMAAYDENLEVAPYVKMTKEQIVEHGRTEYNERLAVVKAFTANPEKGKKKYSEWGERIYAKWDDPDNIYRNFEPESYYKWYTEDSTVNEKGDLMSTYNPNSKWDYWNIQNTLSISDLKTAREKQLAEFERKPYDIMWDIIVEDTDHPELKGIERFQLLYGAPDKENMLALYGDRETFVEHYRNSYSASYCVITPYGWHEPGTVGWWGTSSASPEDEYNWENKYYSRFIEPMDDDETVYLIDCHI